MFGRFTDNARSALRAAFRRRSSAPERDIVAALTRRHRYVAGRVLERAGIAAGTLPPASPQVERRALVAGAVDEARLRGVDYVGTEHVLLALARAPGSVMASSGASAERLT